MQLTSILALALPAVALATVSHHPDSFPPTPSQDLRAPYVPTT